MQWWEGRGAFTIALEQGMCKEVDGRICQHLRLGDDALAMPVQGWYEFSEKIKPKISLGLCWIWLA